MTASAHTTAEQLDSFLEDPNGQSRAALKNCALEMVGMPQEVLDNISGKFKRGEITFDEMVALVQEEAERCRDEKFNSLSEEEREEIRTVAVGMKNKLPLVKMVFEGELVALNAPNSAIAPLTNLYDTLDLELGS